MTRRKSGQISSGTFGFRSIIETGESSISEAPKNVSLRQVTILDVDPDELARQLTVLEHELFRSISLHEFYCQAWSHKTSKNKLAPNLVKFIRYFNHVATGAASEVVRQTNIKARVSVLKKFIYVAHTCIKWANYNTCFEIVAGLNLGPITRLKRTWKALPKKYWDVWNELNQIVSSEGELPNRSVKKIYDLMSCLTSFKVHTRHIDRVLGHSRKNWAIYLFSPTSVSIYQISHLQKMEMLLLSKKHRHHHHHQIMANNKHQLYLRRFRRKL